MDSINQILKSLRAKKFLEDYSINIPYSRFRQLVNGYDGNKKSAEFTQEQKKIIIECLQDFANKILNFIEKEKENANKL